MQKSLRVISIVLSICFMLASTVVLSEEANQEVVNNSIFLAQNNPGVITQRFEGQGRCSQVCPIMLEICQAQNGSPGRCWCDEQAGGVTIGHIVCGQ